MPIRKKSGNSFNDPRIIQICAYIPTFTHSVNVIVVRNGMGDPSSESGRDYLPFTSGKRANEKGINTCFLFAVIVTILISNKGEGTESELLFTHRKRENN